MDFLINNLDYTETTFYELYSDKIPSSNLEFSRIYNHRHHKSKCQWISGKLAHRLFLHGSMRIDSFQEDFQCCFIDNLFKKNQNKSKEELLISTSYLKYMLTDKQFKSLIIHSLNRVLGRLIKGIGFKCNCIAEQLVVICIILRSQDAFIDRSEMDHFQIDRFDLNTWQFEKNNKRLDNNFLLLLEKELNIKINKSLNNCSLNTYKQFAECYKESQDILLFDEHKFDGDIDAENEMKRFKALIIEHKLKMESVIKYNDQLLDYENDCVGIKYLIKSLKINRIHPSKWFKPFDKNIGRFFDYYWDNNALKRIKARKRCIVCHMKKRNNMKLKTCSKCKSDYYCSKKCQKYHWKKRHRESCQFLADCTNIGFQQAMTKHYNIDFNKFKKKA